MLSAIVVISIIVLVLAYRIYGKWLSTYFLKSMDEELPSAYLRDDMDYFPSPLSMLFAHHFSSIAGAGAIVGPVVAASMFGWLPVLIWIVVGSILVGGVHDMSALAMSLKFDGLSIAEVIERMMGRRVHSILLFVFWVVNVLFVASFMDLTADCFVEAPAVGFAVTLSIFFALVLGAGVYVFHLRLSHVTFLLLPVLAYALYYGAYDEGIYKFFSWSVDQWRVFLVVYIYLASVLPAWLLLEPRDYLASFFIYGGIVVGAAGMFMVGFDSPVYMLQPFNGFVSEVGNKPLWPILFVTVACGAVSGAHSMISSGTTPKQLAEKRDVLFVGYGSMLLEALVGVIALGTVILNGDFIAQSPLNCFAVGFGRMAKALGFSHHMGSVMGFMVLNCFVLTTLDTLTRIGRYLLQEITHNRLSAFMATALTLAGAIGLILLESNGMKMWQAIWPVLGSANQLIAAVTLMVVCLWLAANKAGDKKFVIVPAAFMLITSMAAMFILTRGGSTIAVRGIAVFLLILTLALLWNINKKVNLVKIVRDLIAKVEGN